MSKLNLRPSFSINVQCDLAESPETPKILTFFSTNLMAGGEYVPNGTGSDGVSVGACVGGGGDCSSSRDG